MTTQIHVCVSSVSILFALLISNSICMHTPCRMIRPCEEFQLVEVKDIDQKVKQNFNLQSETELAAAGGHWNGIVPISYELFLNFSTNHKYEGSVEITIDIVQRTNRLLINANMVLEIDFRSMVIESASECSEESTDSTACIERVDFLPGEGTAAIKLRDGYLEPGERYSIHFPRFGRPLLEQGPCLVGTNHFVPCMPLRLARTYFPCFDHPSLKSTFRLCVELNQKLRVVTNTPTDRLVTMNGNRIRDCHEVTPKISTASFSFALLNSDLFEREKLLVPTSSTHVEIHFAKADRQVALRILKSTVEAMTDVRRLSQFEYPLSTFSMILTPAVESMGCEGLGWATVFAAENSTAVTIDSIAYAKVMQQYLGHIVTVNDWRELCVLQGLGAYLQWQLESERLSIPMDEVADVFRQDTVIVGMQHDLMEEYVPFGLQQFPSAWDSFVRCSGAPGLFFHTLTQFYEDQSGDDGNVVMELLRAVFRERAYQPTSIEDWDRILERIVVGKEQPAVEGYLKAWFTQPGMLFLLVSQQSADCIRVRQRVLGSQAPAAPVPRPVPIHLHLLDSTAAKTKTKPIILTKLDETICGVEASAHLIDPGRRSVTRKVYSVGNYIFVFRKQLEGEYLNADHFEKVFEDFCHGLHRDLFPLAGDNSATEASWRELMGLVADLSAHGGLTMDHLWCHCCASLTSITHWNEEEPLDPMCYILQLQDCKNLRIARILNDFSASNFRDEL